MIGCVETGTLAEYSINKERSNRGAIALIVSIFLFVTTFGLCIHGYSRRRRAAETIETSRIASLLRRYRYRQSNSSAAVSLAPSLSEGRPIGSSNSEFSSSHDRSTRTRSERSIMTRSISGASKKSLGGSLGGVSESSSAMFYLKEEHDVI